MGADESSRASLQIADGLYNYELKEQLAAGATSLIFRAICKRGRMRNRLVVVKKFHILCKHSNDNCRVVKDPVSAASLHSTLCHPTIVTLLSSFSAPSGFYQVLELCENGSLSTFLNTRDSRTLTEEELRGVARVLVDALAYLKKERVLHRDIKPSNVLLTEHFRVKLSGFGLATRLPRSDSVETLFCGSPNYVSPEILSGLPYRFATDLWSLGSVLVTCLTGQPAFHAPTPEEVFENICSAKYSLPDGLSYEVQDLIAGMLQKEPEDRTPLHRILSHPFFKPMLAIHPLSTDRLERDSSNNTGITPPTNNTCPGSPTQRYPPLLSKDHERLKPVLSCKQQLVFKRTPLDDITNLYYHDISQDDTIQDLRRTTSAPAIPGLGAVGIRGSGEHALAADSGTPSVSSLGALAEEHDMRLRHPQRGSVDGLGSLGTKLKRILSEPSGSTERRSRTAESKFDQPSPAKPATHRVSSQATTSTAVSRSANISTTPWNASARRLKPQTHKLSRGQLVVLPSKALLVDFRESERRRGHEGKQVLMINANGDAVEVYDAPHLSTPCCLAEPVAVYAPSRLPAKYVKQYQDAIQIVDQLKARTPKLIHFSDDAKCTLMANGPPGDVEIHIPAEDTQVDGVEAIRLRLQRSRHTLEISRHLRKTDCTRRGVGEWTRKVISLSHALELPEGDDRSLDGLERLAMTRLKDFLLVCDAAEAALGAMGGPYPVDKHDATGRERLERTLRRMEGTSKDKDLGEKPGARPWRQNKSCASGGSLMVVPPRPKKFPSAVMLR